MPGSKVQSTPSGLIQLVLGGSCLQPAAGFATEGAQLTVNSSCLAIQQEQFNFVPAACECFCCTQVTYGSMGVGRRCPPWEIYPQEMMSSNKHRISLPSCLLFAAQAFQCFFGADISGNPLSTIVNVASSQSCAVLCLTTANCTLYTFQASSVTSVGTCSLRNKAFSGSAGSSGVNPAVAAACLSISASGVWDGTE